MTNDQDIKAIFSDQAFVQSLTEMESEGEVQAALLKKGLDVSLEEARVIKYLLIKKSKAALSEEDLALVTGGTLMSRPARSIFEVLLVDGSSR